MRRILIIDDDEFFAGMVAKIFGRQQWLPIVYYKMEDALEDLKELHVDLIVTDIFMPGIGGIEGIGLLKKVAPGTPIIAITGGWDTLSPDESVKAAIKIGADGGLAKPVNPKQMTALLKIFNLGGAELGEPKWPQTPNKTTDWDTVFDAPVNGLISMISKAKTFDLMKIAATNTLAHLFQNPSTEESMDAYMKRLDDIFKSGNPYKQSETLEVIIAFFNETKTTFKEEDASRTAESNLKRVKERKTIRQKAHVKTNKLSMGKIIAIAGSLTVLLLAGIVAFVIWGQNETYQANLTEESPRQEKKTKVYSLKEKQETDKKDTGTKKDSSKHVTENIIDTSSKGMLWDPDTELEKEVDPPPLERPKIVALTGLKWTFSRGLNPTRILPLLYAKSIDNVPSICNLGSEAEDILTTALSLIPKNGYVPTSTELKPAVLSIKTMFNERLGDQIVTKVMLIIEPDVHKINSIFSPCRILAASDFQNLNLSR